MDDKNKITNYKWQKKRKRIKYHLKQKNHNGLPRLIIFRSNTNIYIQLVDDVKDKTLLSVSSMDRDLKGALEKAKSKIEKSAIVGKAMAEKIKKGKIDKIIFDRNGYKYHGRIKAVGDAIRKEDIQI